MHVGFCTFRLGGRDGVSVEVAKWQRAFVDLGWTVNGVAGSGNADHLVPGLALDATVPPSPDEVERALAPADLVVVDNLCSLPLNAPATEVVASALRDRPAILRHHDLAWQHPKWDRDGWTPPTDPQWRHVAISELSRVQLAERGFEATTAYNTFEAGRVGNRDSTRRKLGVAEHESLLLHPTRAIERKNIPEALALAESIGATYWLTGDAEQGYGPELDRRIAALRTRAIRRPAEDMTDAYAACDAVVFPSTWEGFGNPPVEAAIHRKPAAVGGYPVASELVERFGFRWLPTDDPKPLARVLEEPDREMIDHNYEVASTHFSPESLRRTLRELLGAWGW